MIKQVIHHYMIAALWSSTDSQDNPLDDLYSIEDISPETKDAMTRDCTSFIEKAGDLLNGLDPEQIGHDFWLTRNHHGAGFWDRGLGETGEALTTLAHTYGEIYLFILNNSEGKPEVCHD